MYAITIGLDLAKSVFQVHGEDAKGGIVFQKKLRRAQLEAFFSKQPLCTVGMEACGSAHYWGRALRALGHEVRLIPAAYVKPFVRRNKTDARDAAAICAAMGRADMRYVAIKSVEQQAMRAVERGRELLVKQRTQLSNCFRGLLAEMGIVAAQGRLGLAGLRELVRAGDARVPEPLKATLEAPGRQHAAAMRDPRHWRRHGARHRRGDRRWKALRFGARFRRVGGTDAAREFERRQDDEARHQPARRAAAALAAGVGRQHDHTRRARQYGPRHRMAARHPRPSPGQGRRAGAGGKNRPDRLGGLDFGRGLSASPGASQGGVRKMKG